MIKLSEKELRPCLDYILNTGNDFIMMGELLNKLDQEQYSNAIFLLYNEEKSLSQIHAFVTDPNKTKTQIDNFLQINNIVRRLFLRDYVTHVNYKFYKDYDNIKEQMKIISLILTTQEKTYINNKYPNSAEDNSIEKKLLHFIAIDDGTNSLSDIEQERINEFSNDLNDTSTPLNNILAKIEQSTLH